MQKGRLKLTNLRNQPMDETAFLKKALRKEHNFWTRFCVFKDLRNRGYIVKTALKFGADFRVYDRGVKPGEDHAKWLVYPVKESSSFSWYEFSAKDEVYKLLLKSGQYYGLPTEEREEASVNSSIRG